MESQKQWAKNEDWETHRQLITSLYRDRDMTLKEVAQFMEDNHRFHATIRMYKTRVKQWKLDKTVKVSDIVTITQSPEYNAGKRATTFVVNGREISAEHLERSIKRRCETLRRAKMQSTLGLSSSSVPAALCSPDNLHVSETSARLINYYVNWSFGRGKWVPGMVSGSSLLEGQDQPVSDGGLHLMFSQGLDMMRDGRIAAGRRNLNSGFDILFRVLPTEEPFLLMEILLVLWHCYKTSVPEVFNMLTRTLQEYSRRQLKQHPLTEISKEVNKLGSLHGGGELIQHLAHMIQYCFRPYILQLYPEDFIRLLIRYASIAQDPGPLMEVKRLFQDMTRQPKFQTRENKALVAEIRTDVSLVLHYKGLHDEVLEVLQVDWEQFNGDADIPAITKYFMMECAGLAYHRLGQADMGKKLMLASLEVAEVEWGETSETAMSVLRDYVKYWDDEARSVELERRLRIVEAEVTSRDDF